MKISIEGLTLGLIKQLESKGWVVEMLADEAYADITKPMTQEPPQAEVQEA